MLTCRKFLFLFLPAAMLLALIAGAILQHMVHLEPCPMCILQRYLFFILMVVLLLGNLFKKKWGEISVLVLASNISFLGSLIAGKQSYMQRFAQDDFSCSKDSFVDVNKLSLSELIPQIFASKSSDCSSIDWTFLGGSIANWSMLCFVGVVLICILALKKRIF